MAVYNVINPGSALTSVEFTPVPDGNFSFFHVKTPEQLDAVKQWLVSKEVGQEIVGEALVDKHPVLVTHGDKTQADIMGMLTTRGDTLQLQKHAKGIDMWRVVSMLAVPGQALQIASSFMRKDKKLDWGLFVFGASNLTGHAISWVYGSQKSDDVNRLNFFKKHINETLDEHIPDGSSLPDIHDKRASLHTEPAHPPTVGEKVDGFLRRNSVYVGEIFCRYVGAVALAFPIDKWQGAMKRGSLSEAYRSARNPSPLVHYAGLGSMAGKTTSFLAKSEDPYDPKPKTGLDTFREQYAFRTGGWMETAAFGTLTYDALTNPKRRILFRGNEYRDYVGGLGSALFTIRYIVRYWAKFGEKNVNMDEMYAHVADSLALVSPEKLPLLLAKTAAEITEHFKDKKLDYGQVYTQLMTDLYRYHHIALDNLGTEPEERAAKLKFNVTPPDAQAANNQTRSKQMPVRAGNYAETYKIGLPETLGRSA